MDTTARFLELVWREALLHLWQTTLVWLALGALSLALGSAPARYLHTLYWIGLAKLLLPIALLEPLIAPPIAALVRELGAARPVAAYVTAALHPGPWTAATAGTATPATWLWIALTALWGIGFVSIVWRWTQRLESPLRAFPCPLDRASESLRTKVDVALSGADVRRERIRLGPGRGLPAVAGLVRPAILLPRQIVERLGTDELRAILLHEESHRKRRDPLRALVLRCALSLFYFYPPLWWLAHRLRESSESACDESVLKQGIDPPVYARALARALTLERPSAVPLPAVGLGRASELQRRLKRIESSWRYRPMSRHRLILGSAALLVAACCLPSTPFATEAPIAEAPSSSAAPAETVQGSTPKPLRAGEDGVSKPKILAGHKTEPKYPAKGLQEGVSGIVVVEAVVRAVGSVGTIKVVKNETGHPEFAESAKAAIRQWRYEPAQLNGRPVEVFMTITVGYHLDGGAKNKSVPEA